MYTLTHQHLLSAYFVAGTVLVTGLEQGTEETHLFGDDMCSCQCLVVFDPRRPALTSLAPWPWPSLGPDSGEPWLAWPCSLILPLKVAPASGLRPGFESRPHVLGLCGQGQAAQRLRAAVCLSVNEDLTLAPSSLDPVGWRTHLCSPCSATAPSWVYSQLSTGELEAPDTKSTHVCLCLLASSTILKPQKDLPETSPQTSQKL